MASSDRSIFDRPQDVVLASANVPSDPFVPTRLTASSYAGVGWNDQRLVGGSGSYAGTDELRAEATRWYRTLPEVTELVNSSARLVASCRLQVGVRDQSDRVIGFWKEDGSFNEDVVRLGVTEEFAMAVSRAWLAVKDETGGKRQLLRTISECWQVTARSTVVCFAVNVFGNPITLENPEHWHGHYRYQAFASGSVEKGEVQGIPGVFAPLVPDKKTFLPEATMFFLAQPDSISPNAGWGWVMNALHICRILGVARQAQYATVGSQVIAPPMLVPSQASLKRHGRLASAPNSTDNTGTLDNVQEFVKSVETLLGESVQHSVADWKSAEQLVHRVVGMDGNWIEKVRVLNELRRTLDPLLAKVIADQRDQLAEVAQVPPEALSGFGSTNRWNGREVLEDGFRRWTWPAAQVIGDLLFHYLVRPDLVLAAIDPDSDMLDEAQLDVIDRLAVWVDGKDAQPQVEKWRVITDAAKLGAIGKEGYRSALGIPREFAPNGEGDAFDDGKPVDVYGDDRDPLRDRIEP